MSLENNDFTLFTDFPHPVFMITPEGTILEANRFFVNRFLLTLDEIRGKNVFELISTAFHSPQLAASRRAMADAVVSTGQHIIYDDEHVDGAILRNSIYPVKSPDGLVTQLLIIVHDVTEQVEAERKARHTDHLYKALLDNINGSVFVLDDECLLISGNQHAFNLFGDQNGEIKNNTFCHLVFSEDKPRIKKFLTDIMESGHEVAEEVRMHTHDDRNNYSWFNIYAQKTLIDNRSYLVLVCLDIHHIKISESRLSEYKKWLIKAMDAGNAGVWDWNIVSNAAMWSSKLWDIFGIKKQPGVYPTFELWISAIHPDDRERIVESLTQAISRQSELTAEYRVLHPDGSCRWILESAKPIFDKNGELKRYCGIAIDITEQKKFENEIALIRKHIDAVLEQFNIGWYYLNLNDHSVIRTIEHARIFGYDNLDAEWSFEKFLEHVIDEERENVKNLLDELLSNHNDFTTEYHIRKTNGDKRRILSSGSLVYDDLGKPSHLVGIIQDITDMQNDE